MRRMRISYLFLWIFLFVIDSYAVEVSNEGPKFKGFTEFKIIADSGYTFQDILAMDLTGIKKQPASYLISNDPKWIILQVTREEIANLENEVVSLIGNAISIDFYYYQSGEGWMKFEGGLKPTDQTNSYAYNPHFSIQDIDLSKPIIIKASELVIPAIVIEDSNEMVHRQNQSLIYHALILGGLFVILMLNIFRWLNTWELVFGLYSLYVTTFITIILFFGGNNLIFQIVDISPTFKMGVQLVSILFLNIMAVSYGIVFLKLKAGSPLFHKILVGILIPLALSFLLLIYDPSLGVIIGNYSVAIVLVVLLTASIIQLRKGHTYVSFYVAAYVFFTIIQFAYSAIRNIDPIFPYVFPIPIFFIGFFVEALLLNLSLNQRVDFEKKRAERDKEKSQKELIEFQLQQNLVLEEKVASRTAELENTLDSLQKTQTQLVESEKMASLGILSAGVGHEINNPLNFIKGGIDGLSKHLKKNLGTDDGDTNRYIEIVNEGVNRASEIVNSLAHFSREGTDMEEECDLHEILENCLFILQNKLKHKVTVIKDFSSLSLIKLGNAGRLHQAFLNILSNAEQAIAEKGTITISTELIADDIIISISDNGMGIEEKYLKKIMDPFFTTKDPGVGTGLGLSITYKIIEEHKGTIKVKSSPGEGSDFVISLPNSGL